MDRPPPYFPCLGASPSPPKWPDLCRLEDWFFPSPICSSPSAETRQAPIIHHHQRSSSPAISSAVLFDHHAPERGLHAPASGSKRRRVVTTRCPESAVVHLRSNCCVLSLFLICYVTLCNFLLGFCLVACFFCLVFRCFGVDFIFLYFWLPFGSFFSTVTSHLNLHGLFGRLFRCLNGVFGLPMVVSIIVCAAARVIRSSCFRIGFVSGCIRTILSRSWHLNTI
jgi:hypothetical protein